MDKWGDLERCYLNYKSMLSEKYGDPKDCVSFERDGFLKYSEGYLYSIPVYCDDERDDQQDIKLLAYHYVEAFGEEGHLYWWNEYRKIHPEIEW